MSPLSVRRYRAERLLRREFDTLRAQVLANVRARLRAASVSLDEADLEGCYAIAWHGLYVAMLEGRQEIASPAAWLTVVTHRRALDEHRARRRLADEPGHELGEPERDLAQELDDRAQLRRLLEGLRGRLGAREREAAALCYLQGLSRSEAAARMGISEARMRKLMEGSRPGVPGVAAKVGELLQSIRAGSFCAEQSSLMRAFAFGVLDPDGERHRLARAHQRDCPACRAYVLSLRGLASVLPLPPLPLALGFGLTAGAGAGATGAGAGAGAGSGAASASAGAAGAGTGAAGVATAGAVGSAGAGGGWLLAGGIGAKLAVGCALAVGLGAGCVALTLAPLVPPHRDRRGPAAAVTPRAPRFGASATLDLAAAKDTALASGLTTQSTGGAIASASPAASSSRLTPQTQATREFGPEQPATTASASTATVARASSGSGAALAHTASAGGRLGSASGAAGEPSASNASPLNDRISSRSSTGAATSPAEREFSPG